MTARFQGTRRQPAGNGRNGSVVKVRVSQPSIGERRGNDLLLGARIRCKAEANWFRKHALRAHKALPYRSQGRPCTRPPLRVGTIALLQELGAGWAGGVCFPPCSGRIAGGWASNLCAKAGSCNDDIEDRSGPLEAGETMGFSERFSCLASSIDGAWDRLC